MSVRIGRSSNNHKKPSVAAMRNFSARHYLFLAMLLGVAVLTACYTAEVSSSNRSSTQESADDLNAQTGLPPLISADELAKLLQSQPENLKILEPGNDGNVFSKGHLPTAKFMHWIDDMTDPVEVAKYNIPDAKRFSQVMSNLGIKNSDRIVIYDRFSSRLSTRLFWTLKAFGHDQVQVLDGGFNAGKVKLDLEKGIVAGPVSQYKVIATKKSLIADMNLVQEKLADTNCRLIDGRPADQFSGEKSGVVFHTKKPHSRKGHIPGAKNVFWKDNFNPDGTFKSKEKLKALYQDAGIMPKNDVITYCNEGLHAAPPWFVLTQLLGYKNVRVYDSSLAEWAESEQPMSTLPKSESSK